ncbi:hypothetical protein CKO38_09115 [Rhodospirillum rubrum]|uniref:guanitoxin biosynthesis heme-dependent pre-guanitoxin N-hydroxylase GntA n=1 Tax=Rhodospirillum rubrum TaxID=1085 RepID=UPI001906A714|nr:guanitoxin biosynthesis heme-dependent pre-guanitoxin N-hydroxylase GntA [Rhodospirillum rubrum]MBK1665840.1 hypothetical protein [Rhodospirillum rubrum]MBK1676827.1 hypothetical protein [Rhodospirillum rubrum]
MMVTSQTSQTARRPGAAPSPSSLAAPLVRRFRGFIEDGRFPCVGAKAALSRDRLAIVVAGDIRLAGGDRRIHAALVRMVRSYHHDKAMFRSLAVIFESPRRIGEPAFERHLWARLNSLHRIDRRHFGWSGAVSPDPADPHFGMSFAGAGFFVVGLHPGASRPARRFVRPTLVFNMHDQFERLRAEGRYEKMRATILERDRKLAGSINPMLAAFGERSEARQYSGRVVAEGWRCPFHAETTAREIRR